MHPSPLRIEAVAGYTPMIGPLVGMLTYARNTTIAAVERLTLAELDHLHDPQSIQSARCSRTSLLSSARIRS
jgi:hypothetical protein